MLSSSFLSETVFQSVMPIVALVLGFLATRVANWFYDDLVAVGRKQKAKLAAIDDDDDAKVLREPAADKPDDDTQKVDKMHGKKRKAEGKKKATDITATVPPPCPVTPTTKTVEKKERVEEETPKKPVAKKGGSKKQSSEVQNVPEKVRVREHCEEFAPVVSKSEAKKKRKAEEEERKKAEEEEDEQKRRDQQKSILKQLKSTTRFDTLQKKTGDADHTKKQNAMTAPPKQEEKEEDDDTGVTFTPLENGSSGVVGVEEPQSPPSPMKKGDLLWGGGPRGPLRPSANNFEKNDMNIIEECPTPDDVVYSAIPKPAMKTNLQERTKLSDKAPAYVPNTLSGYARPFVPHSLKVKLREDAPLFIPTSIQVPQSGTMPEVKRTKLSNASGAFFVPLGLR